MFDEADDVQLEDLEFKGKLETVEAVKEFCLGGNARVTIKSLASGKRFTFRIAKKRGAEENDPYFVSVLRGSNNDVDFAFFGCLHVLDFMKQQTKVPQFIWSRKSYLKSNAPAVVAFSWFWNQIGKGTMPPNAEVWHEGRCGCCGRTLTVPESVARGIGPECAMKLHAASLLDSLF